MKQKKIILLRQEALKNKNVQNNIAVSEVAQLQQCVSSHRKRGTFIKYHYSIKNYFNQGVIRLINLKLKLATLDR